MSQKKPILIFIPILMLLCIVLAISITFFGHPHGWSEKALLQQINHGANNVALPTKSGWRTWDKALIVCPYATAKSAPVDFQETISTLDTNSSESTQWIIYHTPSGMVTDQLSRNQVDFCYDSRSSTLIDAGQQFSVRKSEGTYRAIAN
ncbi:hypothetical protein [Bifidobacterium vespertilionis]|uniref:Uncharacterized protein n=1 Tax=Bifidobacterium vespertilionis TaxID=2562524 RepID=A0A5J5DTI8_9BIFI|nr:hypothetical protein [Bifidobacterium vespertilionis]KAA8818623.1 hypothetical protein EMO90_09640 [Bifidobacterium vespertilionis]KAA8823078.1 hypothetical protein EM848_06925 [Bifidobacterium vespertilionis]